MAIEPMKRIAAIVPADELPSFTSWLHEQSILHLASLEDLSGTHESVGRAMDEVRDKVAKFEQTLSFCEEWGGLRQTFLENLISAKRVARVSELEDAARKLDPDALQAEIVTLRGQRDSLVQRVASFERECGRLKPFVAVETPLAGLGRLRYMTVVLVRLGQRGEEELDRACPETLVWEKLSDKLFWFAFPAMDEKAADYLASLSAGREEVPGVETSVRERLDALTTERTELLKELEQLDGECREFAVQRGRDAELGLAYWQSEMHRAEGLEKIVASRRVGVAHGYLSAAQLEWFANKVRDTFKGEIVAADPRPGEPVPVNIKLNRFFRPGALLVDMYGVPDYFSIDPTPFVTFAFLVFFGLCFSDAIYGLALMLVGAALARKFRDHAGLRQFSQLFVYGGVSTFVFGALTGSWASNLYEYLGDGNILERICNLFPHFDPLEKVIFALVGAIFIGVASQYCGIVMRIRRDWRRGDRKAAIFDGGLWFPYLTGLIILVACLFVKVPAKTVWVGVALLVVGAIGLVLTQGRDQESVGARFVYGLISLYGIMGSYGATSFISDALSYSRLLALGLTTALVGKAFNILGQIVSGTPWIGIALFVAVVLFGHSFNFFMSIIGSFVHSARLIMLEFFGRFYEVGQVKYQPFGVRSERVEILRPG